MPIKKSNSSTVKFKSLKDMTSTIGYTLYYITSQFYE